MNEPYKIPAASIEGIDLKRIAARSQTAAYEIMRIGRLLDEGLETGDDLVRLCELLHTYGESAKSEELLRCNIVGKDDAFYQAYHRLHGFSVEKEFERRVSAFSDQFGVRLTSGRELGFLRRDCTSLPESLPADLDPAVFRFLSNPCSLEFRYTSKGCTADIYSNADGFPEQEYLILGFNNGLWRRIIDGKN
jgi:hypothetical protein